MKELFLFFFIFYFSLFSLLAQNKQIDSLRLNLSRVNTDIKKANICFDIGTQLQNINPDSAVFYFNKALCYYSGNNSSEIFPSFDKIVSSSSQIDFNRRMEYANTLLSLSWVFGNIKGQPDTAIFIANKGLSIYSNLPKTADKNLFIKFENNVAICYNTMASIYNNIGYLDKAMEFYKKALNILEKIKVNVGGISNCYMNIGIVYDEQSLYDNAIDYYNKALKVNKNPENKRISGNCYTNLGIVYFEKGEYNQAVDYYKMALKINEDLGDIQSIAISYNNIGLVYREQGAYVKAIDFFQKALKINEQVKNTSSIASNYCNIGLVHLDQCNYNKSLDYFQKALSVYEKIEEKEGEAICCNNIGTIYNNLHQWDKAIDYLKKSIKIREILHDKNGLAACYSNIGTNYLHQGDFQKTEEFYQKAITIYQGLGVKNELSTLYNNFADLLIKLKDNNKAVIYAEKGLLLAKETGTLPNENLSYRVLQNAYTGLGKLEKALEYAELFISSRDSLFRQEKTKAIAEMESKYQSEKKQLEIDKLAKEKELQNSEMKKQQLIILFIVCGLLFVLGFTVILFRLFIQKKNANIIITEKNKALQVAYEEINTQKEEIIVQRDSIQDQKELIEEHQKEIDDSINYAKRIQQAVMPDLTQILNTKYQNPNTKTQGGLKFGTWSLEFESFILFKPKDIVSGDFYWATRINEWLIVTVVDCTGHGVPGAFMSMLGISFLNEIVRKKEVTNAADVLEQLRTSVLDALKQQGASTNSSSFLTDIKDGMDMTLCAINIDTLEMQFAGANNPVYVIAKTSPVIASETQCSEAISATSILDCFAEARNDDHYLTEPVIEFSDSEQFDKLTISPVELIEIKGDKMPIGIHSNMKPFTNQIYLLKKGDIIYLMSDGYEDQFGGPNRKKFLAKNLKTLLTANSQLPMANQKHTLETTIKEWIGTGEQIDDITILGIKI